jgi:hypothetical protein
MQKQEALYTDIILIDIINFSKLEIDQQLEIVTFLTKSFRRVIRKILSSSHMKLSHLIEGFISTGDGFYCILNPKFKGYGAILALSFNHFSDQISKKYTYFNGIRIAVHTGYIHSFKDILDNNNFIGDGLNDCARFLEHKNYTISTVTISENAFEHFRIFLNRHKDYEQLLAQMGFKHSSAYSFKDKHSQEKKGYLIWLRKSAIIIPPKIYLNQGR